LRFRKRRAQSTGSRRSRQSPTLTDKFGVHGQRYRARYPVLNTHLRSSARLLRERARYVPVLLPSARQGFNRHLNVSATRHEPRTIRVGDCLQRVLLAYRWSFSEILRKDSAEQSPFPAHRDCRNDGFLDTTAHGLNIRKYTVQRFNQGLDSLTMR
jgi:hypothetical protein